MKTWSPLAEGRELKLDDPSGFTVDVASPLAEGRELKFCQLVRGFEVARRRPSRRGVN